MVVSPKLAKDDGDNEKDEDGYNGDGDYPIGSHPARIVSGERGIAV